LSRERRLVSAGRVGRAHGRDGSFYVERAAHPLPAGTTVAIGTATYRVERRAGTDQRPLVRLSGLDAPRELRGEVILVEDRLAEDEWLAEDLVGLRVEGLGAVRRLVEAPSCSLLELEDGTLVPLVSDAVRAVDLERGVIDVDLDFLGPR
jgi:16S rRNA processing protein RimM